MELTQWLSGHWLDFFTTLLGLLYILLEYKASIWLWLVGIIMPALDIILYWSHGLYGDAGMATYYTIAAIYGYAVWKIKEIKSKNAQGGIEDTKPKASNSISHFPKRLILPTAICFLAAWGITYWILVNYTNSSIPATDAFTNALSFVALWALAKKHVEQWMLWIVVDAVSCYLYITKGIPFKAALYGLYVVIAIMGYRKWIQLMNEEKLVKNH
ncbi:MAG: nicotinamide mononucleotide transporter [Prevotella sp.]|nr:nicotinamide mononucleotide transporter [Prevotella sp.]